MHVASFEDNLGTGRIEVFKFQLAQFAAIHGITPFAAKLLHIKFMSPFTNLFIGIKANTNLSVLNFRMLHQVNHCRYNFGYASLIIRSEQCFAVCYNQVFTFMV